MQKIMKKIIVLIFAIAICLSITNISFAEENNEKNFEIESFDVELNVKEDNKVEVKETLEVHFFKEDSHGIYRAIPIWESYTGQDGQTVEKRARVTDFKCDGEKISYDSSATMFRAKIGDPDRIVPQYKTYNISYTYDLGKDTYKDRDEFIFHAFGDDLGGDVPYAKITLKFENNSITKDKISIWKDKFRKENIYDNGKNNDTQTSVASSENGVVINLADVKSSITIETVLKEGYFATAEDTYGSVSLILCIVIMLISVSTVVVWFIFGKDNKVTVTETVCYPPDNLDPANMGMVLASEGITYSKYNALAVSLASKGYISIAKDPRDKDNFFVKKLIDINKPLPSGVKELTDNEKLIYESIFRGTEVIVSLKENKIDETKLQEVDENTKKFREKIFEKRSSILQIVYLVLEFVSLIILAISFFAVKDMNPVSNWIYVVTFIIWIISVVFMFLLEKKTSYGDKLAAEVKSYKEFLKGFDKEQCTKLLKENPKFFYETLPYTYVFGITKNWIKEINAYPDLARFCNAAYFQNSMMFLAYHYIFINNVSNPSNYHGGGSYGGLGGSSGVGSW